MQRSIEYLKRERLCTLLFLAATALLAMYGLISKLPVNGDRSLLLGEINRQFDLNGENNIASWFSTFLWLISAAHCYILARNEPKARQGRFWSSLCYVAIYLSADESAQLHEFFGAILDEMGVRLPVYNWEVFGFAIFVIIGFASVRTLLMFPMSIQFGISIAGGIFLTGALGLESLGALVNLGVIQRFPFGVGWTLMIGAEEFLEMVGVISFIGVLRHRMVQLSLPLPACNPSVTPLDAELPSKDAHFAPHS